MKNILMDKIMVEACSGATIRDCIRESLQLATEKWEKIILKHNDILYEIDPKIIAETIHRNKKIKIPKGDE